ncbi:transposase [Streptomyces populi]
MLCGCGLTGTRLFITNRHSGLVKAVRGILLGAAYQRRRVHLLRDDFAAASKDSGEMVAMTIRAISTQPVAEAVRVRLDIVTHMLG